MNFFSSKLLKTFTYVFAFSLTTVLYAFVCYYVKNSVSVAIDDKNHSIGVERMINLSHEMIKDYEIIFKNTEKLASHIRENPNGETYEYQEFIQKSLMPRDLSSFFNRKNTDFVTAYIVAPDDIISVVYPNIQTKIKEISFFSDNNSEYYMKLAKNNPEDTIVQGPVLSPRSHEVVVFNRKAVYVDGKYWGYVGLIADFYKFLECVRLSVEDDQFVYAIRSSVDKGTNDFIWGDNSLFKRKEIYSRQKSVFFGKQRWDLALRVKEGYSAKNAFNTIYVMMTILYLLAMFMTYWAIKYSVGMNLIKTEDLLTGTMNHELFISNIHKELRNESEHGLIVLELIHFNQVNNIFGHETGDALLVEITKRIRTVINYNDQISRIGAEFMIFMPNIKSVIDVEKVRSDLRDVMEPIIYVNSFAIKQRVVVGASSTIEQGREFSEIFHRISESVLEEKKSMTFYSRESDIKKQSDEAIMARDAELEKQARNASPKISKLS